MNPVGTHNKTLKTLKISYYDMEDLRIFTRLQSSGKFNKNTRKMLSDCRDLKDL